VRFLRKIIRIGKIFLNIKTLLKNKYKRLFSVLLILLFAVVYGVLALSYDRQDLSSESNTLTFYAIDVGQGDSFFFVLPNGENVLIDAGPEEAGSKVVSFLRKHGVKKIDLLVATHGHSDHIGGMRKVLQNFEIGKVWDSGFNHGSSIQRNFYKTIKKKDIPFGRPKRGYSELMGDVLFEVLAPARVVLNTKSDTNNNCLVIKITYGDISFLMTADMEREQRSTIQPLPHATVLKASHHGSYNGTDVKLLREVSPSLVVLSYGKNNSYGYPHKRVVKDIRNAKIARYDTVNGTIKIETNGSDMNVFGTPVKD